jgi:hypothetical protein
METVTHAIDLPVSPDVVRERIREDVPAFIRASGFDSVTVTEDAYTVSRSIGLATLELTLEAVESDAVLALDQSAGFFDTMWTEYRVEPTDTGSRVTASTEFTIGRVLGPVLDGTMIRKQRLREFEAQFEYLREAVAEHA